MDFLNVSVVHGKMLNETLRKSFSPQDTRGFLCGQPCYIV